MFGIENFWLAASFYRDKAEHEGTAVYVKSGLKYSAIKLSFEVSAKVNLSALLIYNGKCFWKILDPF